MSAVFDLDDDPALFARERDRFLASLETIPTDVPSPSRQQDRTAEPSPGPRREFRNTPDSDPSLVHNRQWADGIRSRMKGSDLGYGTVSANTHATQSSLDAVIDEALAAGAAWRELGAAGRAEILHRAGDVMERRRAELLEVMGSEAGKVIEQGDPEVSEAIDFAHYYAQSAIALEHVDGARPVPARLTVVTPPWNFPVAIPAGSTLSALASGSPVIIKPARQARRSGAVMVEALWEAGVPREVLHYVQLDGRELGQRLVSHPSVERVILTGGYETAELFHSFRADLRLLAETSGKNAIIVTPSADLDLAAKDVAYSAFGHAGQKCSAASLVILVGSVAKSERLRRQLLDAVSSYDVGMPWQAESQIGPLIGPAEGKLHDALTRLERGEKWVLEPEKLDADGALWRPAVKEGVRPGSPFHKIEYFGPVLGIMTADTLEQAIEYVNAIDYGLTSGLHSLDEDEIHTWLATVDAGNLYVNRGITGAIVQRQPFGGWKKASVGASTKAGGPSYLFGLVDWEDAAVVAEPDATDDRLTDAVLRAARGSNEADARWLRDALSTDVAAWRDEFGIVRDRTGLETEQNALRYQAVPVTVRFEGTRVVELLRVVAAGLRAGSAVTVSSATKLPSPVRSWLKKAGVEHGVQKPSAWRRRAAALATDGGRIRLIGGSLPELAAMTDGSPAVAIYAGDVVSAGRVEMLPFVREQAVSITAHRFGTPHRYEIGMRAPAGVDAQ